MNSFRLILRIIPWLLVIILVLYLWLQKSLFSFDFTASQPQQLKVTHNTILERTQQMGKLELVKYNFQEITQLEEISKTYLNFFKMGPDSKAVLISRGEAVGCIDLAKIDSADILMEGDSVYVTLPDPELCYYKLNAEETEIFSLETGYTTDRKGFIEKAYRHAERQIKNAALQSNILPQTRQNATLVLKPMLEQISGKKVFLNFKMKGDTLNYLD